MLKMWKLFVLLLVSILLFFSFRYFNLNQSVTDHTVNFLFSGTELNRPLIYNVSIEQKSYNRTQLLSHKHKTTYFGVRSQGSIVVVPEHSSGKEQVLRIFFEDVELSMDGVSVDGSYIEQAKQDLMLGARLTSVVSQYKVGAYKIVNKIEMAPNVGELARGVLEALAYQLTLSHSSSVTFVAESAHGLYEYQVDQNQINSIKFLTRNTSPILSERKAVQARSLAYNASIEMNQEQQLKTLAVYRDLELKNRHLRISRQELSLGLSLAGPSAQKLKIPSLALVDSAKTIKSTSRTHSNLSIKNVSIDMEDLLEQLESIDLESEIVPNELYLNLKKSLQTNEESSQKLLDRILSENIESKIFRLGTDLLYLVGNTWCQEALRELMTTLTDHKALAYVISSVGLTENPEQKTFDQVFLMSNEIESSELKSISRLAVGNLGRSFRGDHGHKNHNLAYKYLYEVYSLSQNSTERDNALNALGNLGHNKQLSLVVDEFGKSKELRESKAIMLLYSLRFSHNPGVESLIMTTMDKTGSVHIKATLAETLSFRIVSTESIARLIEEYKKTSSENLQGAILSVMIHHRSNLLAADFFNWASQYSINDKLRSEAAMYIKN